MCYGCYEEAGKPRIVNEEVEKAADLVRKLYNQPGCGAGGYAHIVTDDWNLKDNHIDFCIQETDKAENEGMSEESKQVCLDVLNQFKKLSLDERYSALAIVDGFIPYVYFAPNEPPI